MKTPQVLLAWLVLAGLPALAQDPVRSTALGADLLALSPPVGVHRTAEELEKLLAPIALYPDALIALILPAATVPADVVLAARQLRADGAERSQIEHRAWDESVKSLTHYPDVLKWMDENLQWTKQVGEAFVQQPVDVMQTIQRLRARARAAGMLVDTPQQQVLAELETIRIVPAQADFIYVPRYEPAMVFLPEPVAWGRPVLTFGVGVRVGSWLAHECDWRRHTIWVGNRHRRWSGHDWHRPVVPIPVAPPATARHPEVRPWRPPPAPPRPFQVMPVPGRSELVQTSPVAPADLVTRQPGPPKARPPGAPPRSRRDTPLPETSETNPPPATPVLAPPLVMAPFGRVPAGPANPTPEVTPATPPPPRRSPPARQTESASSEGFRPRPVETARRAEPNVGVAAPPPAQTRAAPPPSRAYSPPPAAPTPATASPAPPAARPAPVAPSPPPSAPPPAPAPRASREPDRAPAQPTPKEP